LERCSETDRHDTLPKRMIDVFWNLNENQQSLYLQSKEIPIVELQIMQENLGGLLEVTKRNLIRVIKGKKGEDQAALLNAALYDSKAEIYGIFHRKVGILKPSVTRGTLKQLVDIVNQFYRDHFGRSDKKIEAINNLRVIHERYAATTKFSDIGKAKSFIINKFFMRFDRGANKLSESGYNDFNEYITNLLAESVVDYNEFLNNKDTPKGELNKIIVKHLFQPGKASGLKLWNSVNSIVDGMNILRITSEQIIERAEQIVKERTPANIIEEAADTAAASSSVSTPTGRH